MSNLFKLAENLLNNLDQSTQSSIQSALSKPANDAVDKNELRPTPPPVNHLKNKSLTNSFIAPGSKSTDEWNMATSLSASSSSINLKQSNFSSSLKNSNERGSTANIDSWNPKSTTNKEDELINFLNSSEISNLSSSLAKLNSDKSENLESSLFSEDTVKFIVGDKSSRSSKRHSENEESNPDEVTHLNEETTDERRETAESDLQDKSKDSNEKKVLQKEIISLNQEVKSLLKRIKASEDEYQRSRRKMDHFQSQISESDKIIRELRAREEDMSESIRSKDSQLAILRVRFEEADNELKEKRKEIEVVRGESDRILRDHSNSSDIQSQAFETLKEKLNDLETNLQREKEAYTQAQKEHMSIQNKLETERHTLTETLQSLEKKLNDEKSKNSDLSAQLKNVKSSNNHVKQELEEYKLKATKTLQAKDRLIATLKESAAAYGTDSADPDNPNASNLPNLKSIEIDELKGERDYLKDELNSKTTSLEMLRSEMMELESQTSVEIETLKDQIRTLTDQIDEQKQSKDYLDHDVKNLRQQLDFAHDELYKQKSNLNSRIQEREAEIERLRSQLTTKNLGTTTEKELENRLHLLTENLIQKQTLIEALQSEKHSIFLQLERCEKRLQDYENIVSSKKSTISIRMSEDDEITTNKLPYLRESPYDHEVTRKVKRAASEIDKFSIRLGVFLKKYPIARIFVIFYMVLLHLWVAIVLFTYKPEAHDLSFNPSVLPHHP